MSHENSEDAKSITFQDMKEDPVERKYITYQEMKEASVERKLDEITKYYGCDLESAGMNVEDMVSGCLKENPNWDHNEDYDDLVLKWIDYQIQWIFDKKNRSDDNFECLFASFTLYDSGIPSIIGIDPLSFMGKTYCIDQLKYMDMQDLPKFEDNIMDHFNLIYTLTDIVNINKKYIEFAYDKMVVMPKMKLKE